jgi:hypothetical protein
MSFSDHIYRALRKLGEASILGIDPPAPPDLTRNLIWAVQGFNKISFGDAKLYEIELDAIRNLPEIEPTRSILVSR